jgi:cytoskeletal protein RodZ
MAMLEGEISQINLIERLVELWREQFTGAIRFESDGIIKIVYFKSGDILSASTNDRADSVDEILMRAGKVTREHVKQALAKRKENETLGDALLNLGFITRKELTWARRVQVVGVIRSITSWQTGSFTIVADYLPKRDEGTLFPLPMVLVELIVTDQDRQKFDRALDGGSAVYAKTPDFDDVFRRLGLNDEAERIAEQIDGERSVADVATASGGETFNVYKLVHALATLGILTRVAQPQFSLDDFASAGVADAADMWSEPEPSVVVPPEPVMPQEPMFQLDEAEALRQPTMEIRLPSLEDDHEIPAPAPQPVAHSAWDDEEDETIAPPPPIQEEEERMPAWDTPVPSVAVPIQAPIEPPAEEPEEQWGGFDEAQIETAARADVPVSKDEPVKPFRAPKPERTSGSRYGLIIALLVFAIIAGGGYAGWMWWQGRAAEPEPAPAPVVRKTPPPRKKATAPPATTTVAALTETAPATTTTVAPAVTQTTQTAAPVTPAPAPKPLVVATTPAPTAAPPPAGSPRERYDAMARDFAKNASGNFTVQIQILCEPSNLAKAMSAGGDNVWFVPQTIGSRSCYRVFWGRYNTRDEAQQALGAIPAGVRDPSAAVKAVPKG